MKTYKRIDVERAIKRITLNNKILLLLPLLFILLLLFRPIESIAIPFIFGAIFAYIISPLTRLLRKHLHISHIIAVILIFLLFTGIIIIFFLLGIHVLRNELTGIVYDQKNFVSLLDKSAKSLPQWTQPIFSSSKGFLHGIFETNKYITLSLLSTSTEVIVQLLLFFLTFFYLLKDAERIAARMRIYPIVLEVHAMLRNYFRSQLLLIVCMSLVTGIFLQILGVPNAFMLGIFSGVAETVPYVGPFIATILAVSIAFLSNTTFLGNSTFITCIIIVCGYTIFRHIEDYFFMPFVLGKTLQLHPLLVLFTSILAGTIFGIPGLLLGTPVIGVYKVMLDYIFKEDKVLD